jgi:hypothetical protein
MRLVTRPGGTLQDFLAFLAACYPGDPNALERAGASDEDIAELSRLAGFPLPPMYDAFLREFGANTGRTYVGGDGGATVSELLDNYRDPLAMADAPKGGIIISTGGLMHERFLICTGVGEPEVGCFVYDEVEYVMARSFEHLLYQETWTYARIVKSERPSLTATRLDTKLVSELPAVLARLGLESYWFSDAYGHFAESDDLWVASRADASRTTVWIGGLTEQGRHGLRDELRRALSLWDERDVRP